MSSSSSSSPTSLSTTTDDTAESNASNLTATILSNVFLFFLIFGLSATVSIRKLKSQLQNKFALATGVGMQFFIMPLLGFASVYALQGSGLTHAMGVTLLVVTSSPGGSYSNLWCSLFNADLALSVAMTAVSTILSIGMLPANLLLYSTLAFGSGEDSVVQALDFFGLFVSLGIVVGAIIGGLCCSYYFENPIFQVWANRSASVSGIALILVSVFLSSGNAGTDTTFWSHPWAFYVGVAIPCFVGIVLANVLSNLVRLSKPETVSIAIECCYQNTGIATSIAVTMFSDPTERAAAVSVPLFYGFLEAVVICIYCIWSWKVGWTKAPKDEKFCVVIGRTYEMESDGDIGGLRNHDAPAEGLPRIIEESDNEEQSSLGGVEDLETPNTDCKGKGWPLWGKRRQNTRDTYDEDTSLPESVGKPLPWWRKLWKSNSTNSFHHHSVASKSTGKKGKLTSLTPSRNRISSEDNTVLTTQSRNRAASEDSGTPIGALTESPRTARRQLFHGEEQMPEQPIPVQLLPQLLTTDEGDEEDHYQHGGKMVNGMEVIPMNPFAALQNVVENDENDGAMSC
mmetsp:Transcript_1899/g.2568  ORF Transcript_1899/g.2568 Transcript_1899/m.2568 type:complete len:569 (-) Transcript_1899:114-1820(-)